MKLPNPSTPAYVLYFNGLGNGKTRARERLAFAYLAERGIKVTHAHINWYSDENFKDLFMRMTKIVQEQLQAHGKVVLVGASAGGSLAVNILGKLHSEDLSVITLCSRLRLAELPWWDQRNLTRMAHLNSSRPTQAFFDSVTFCARTTIPNLTETDKQHLVIVQQWADFVVPRATMGIKGVLIYPVPALGHGWGIAMGAWRLPQIIASMR